MRIPIYDRLKEPGVYESASEWAFAVFVAGVLWFLIWVAIQLGEFLLKEGGL